MSSSQDPWPNGHDEAQALLPWYATGTIDAGDRARVEVHLLACPRCQSDLALERRVAAEVAGLSIGVEEGWAALLPRLQAADRKRRGAPLSEAIATALGRARAAWSGGPAWIGWAVAAQVALLAVIVAVARPPAQEPGYRALGGTLAPPSANMVVIFRPNMREETLRQAIRSIDGRLVGGPTAADAYLLNVPVSSRAAALARLRTRADIELAEPIDAGRSP